MSAESALYTDDVVSQETITFPTRDQKKLALADIKEGLQKWNIWFMLAYQDIKLRYRRSILGPFWITASMAITVYSMGFLYGHLFHTDLQTYFPFLVAGMISWTLISTSITDLVDTFSNVEGVIKQIKLPYTLYVHRVVMRNFIGFFHNILVIVPVLIIFHQSAKLNSNILFLIPGLCILYLNCISYGLILSMIGARYRDVSQVIKSMVQVIFFLTPVLWRPSALPASKLILVEMNPFYAFIELIRAPLLGALPTISNLVVVSLVTVLGLIFSFKLFARRRARIIYWL